MNTQLKHTWQQRLGLLLLIFVFVSAVYLLSYSARIESTDALFLFDATSSYTLFGDFLLDLTNGITPPGPHHLQPDVYPLSDVNTEPLQMFLASPLYQLGLMIPQVGLVHSVYLFNVLVSAASVGVLFLYALALGYSERTATFGALLFGLATILWVYSKSFFQEPLLVFMVLITGYFLERWRLSRYRQWWFLLAGVGTAVLAIFSKAAAVLALPALMLIVLPALPTPLTRRHVRRIVLWGGLALGVLALVFALRGPLGFEQRLDRVFESLNRPHGFFLTAIQGYLLSIGGSVWGTSPVILLGIPSLWWLHQRRQYRYVLVFGMMLASLVLIYALRQGHDWFGGLSWPPRFLMPVIPFAILLTLPLLDRLQRRQLPRWGVILCIALIAYSVWIQFTGVSVWWRDYAHALPPESGAISEWSGGLYDLRYLRWVVIPRLWGEIPLDFAWVRMEAFVWAVAAGIFAGFVLWLIRRELQGRGRIWIAPLACFGFIALTFSGLSAFYEDPLYQTGTPNLAEMVQVIDAETTSDDVVLLSDLTYYNFFMNYGGIDTARVVSLPFHPGEQPSPEQVPEIVSGNVDHLLEQTSPAQIHTFAQSRDRLWLFVNSGPFIPWAVRPAERFMAAHYYPVREINLGDEDNARLIEYSTVSAPEKYTFSGPEILTDLTYGEALRLAGYTLPQGTHYRAGDYLPISFSWESLAPVEQDYTVVWFLRDATGYEIAKGMDSRPNGGFEYTSTWQTGETYWDNRALSIPSDTAAGEYQLWVVVYAVSLDGEILNQPVQGAQTLDGFIGVLPTTITLSDSVSAADAPPQ